MARTEVAAKLPASSTGKPSPLAWETRDRAQIHANERAHFTPTVVKAGPLMRMFGPRVDGRLKTDDQSGPVRTATYKSLAGFMRANGLLQAADSLTFRR